MSTKNLARTVIEGGRVSGMTWRYRYGCHALRASPRRVLARLAVSESDGDDWVVPRPPKLGRPFRGTRSRQRQLDARTNTGGDVVSKHIRPSLPCPERELVAWLSGRRIGACGGTLFWFIPTARAGYRRHRLLDDADAALWRSLPDWFRACHDSFAPRPNTERTS
jgi:hypothetical protein